MPGRSGTETLGFFAVGKRILQDGVERSPKAGRQHLHIAIVDHTRLAYAELLATEQASDCAAFLARAVARYAEAAQYDPPAPPPDRPTPAQASS